jgi:hypothetical protein
MGLTTCPDCGQRVSTSAAACPHCGRPLDTAGPANQPAPACRYCGKTGVQRVRGLHGSEVAIGHLLTLLCFVPGVIYYIAVESRPFCSHCGRRN